MTKTITATFVIPKARIKNANVPLNHIVASIKSAWIREYSEKVWAEAVQEAFGITAIEPNESDWKILSPSEEIQEHIDSLQKLSDELENAQLEKEQHEKIAETHKEDKKLLRQEKKNDPSSDLVDELDEKISTYNHQSEILKAKVKRAKTTLSVAKKKHSPEIKKELNKVTRSQRKLYIAKKLELNKDKQIFDKCAVIVTVHNITNREFDAANFFPTVKPILDGATDSAIVWEDDNNSIIQGGVIFLPGTNLQRDNYVLEIEITSEWAWDSTLKTTK